jgi:hypothetical protein
MIDSTLRRLVKFFGIAGVISIGCFLLIWGVSALILNCLLLYFSAGTFTIQVVNLAAPFLAAVLPAIIYSPLKKKELAENAKAAAFDEQEFWHDWTKNQNIKHGLAPLPEPEPIPSSQPSMRELAIRSSMEELGKTREEVEAALRKYGL